MELYTIECRVISRSLFFLNLKRQSADGRPRRTLLPATPTSPKPAMGENIVCSMAARRLDRVHGRVIAVALTALHPGLKPGDERFVDIRIPGTGRTVPASPIALMRRDLMHPAERLALTNQLDRIGCGIVAVAPLPFDTNAVADKHNVQVCKESSL